MNFVAALKFGSTPEVEAARCMKQLLYRSEREGRICFVLTADLFNELFKAIGLHTKITAFQLEIGNGFDWEAAGCRQYIFHCNSIFFSAFERFLMQLCRTVRDEQENFENTHARTEPIVCLLEVLDIWCNCYLDLLAKEGDLQVYYLQEPLARINYRLFLGLQRIRRQYHPISAHMDEICTRLLDSALQGLFFKECHAYIVNGLIELVEKHIVKSNAFAKDAFKFIYLAFSVEQQKTTAYNLFKCLTRILNKLAIEADRNIYRTFLSFLIDKNMQEICYTILKQEKTKRILLAALSFLNVLQEQLLDLDSFSKTFVEAILGLVLHADENIASHAAELYIEMTRRKTIADDFLLKHLLEFYFMEMNTLDNLSQYVAAIWPNFAYMKSLRIYFELLKDESVPLEMRYFIANFTIAVYSKMLVNSEKYAPEIIYVFQTLPILFTMLNSQCLKGILLQLCSLTEMKLLRDIHYATEELLVDFENYFLYEFKNGVNLQSPYLLNFCMQFARCLEETKHFEKLEMCGIHAQKEYEELISSLPAPVDKKQPTKAQLNAFNDILQKICVLLQVDYDVLDALEPLIRTLHARLIEKPQLHLLANKHQLFIDVYATEVLVYGCIKLSHDKDLTQTSQQWLVAEIRALETYLLHTLTNAAARTSAEVYRAKTHFTCLVNLYCTFHNSGGIFKLPLNIRPYHILVQTLLTVCLQRKSTTSASSQFVSEENMVLHPKYILSYQKCMFEKFAQLHSSKFVALPSPAAWKICLHYGLTSHKFNEELRTFMNALILHHFKIFTRITAVLVYNLYKQKPPFKMDVIKSLLRAQKSFIDQLPAALSPSLLCVNVVLQVLQILQESLQKLPPTTGGNRLVALKHLNHYTWNLNVSGDNVLTDICTQAKLLQNHMLNNAEQVCLDTYLSALSVYTKAKEKA